MEKKVKVISVEDALKNLESIVKQLESGETDLETSLKLFEQGTILIADCQKKLKNAELKITELSESSKEA